MEAYIDLHMPDENGATTAQRLREEQKATRRVNARLLPLDIPEAGKRLWEIFWELDVGREEGFNGIANISHTQIFAWCSITGEKLRAPEIGILLAMDRARRAASSSEAIERRTKANKEPLTPASFKAMFGR